MPLASELPGRAPAGEAREFTLSDAEFERLRGLVREHTGIALADSKRELVYGRLVRRLRKLAMPSFAAYIHRLESDDPAEFEEFVNAITTNLTAFFREDHHFRYLAEQVLPQFAARGAGQRLRIWSAGCSTGEEPYSIAITLAEAAAALRGQDVRVLATDLDSNVLAHAKEGIYEEARFEKMPAARREQFFTNVGPGRWRVKEAVRGLITFNQLNLMNAWPMRGPFDVIFCRNVVIYFDKPTQRELFARMAALQRPGDLLFIGHSESLFRVSESYELVGKTVYRRLAP
jgi:chemotaxis protein methyltransferase CheR